jgi:TolB-like protein
MVCSTTLAPVHNSYYNFTNQEHFSGASMQHFRCDVIKSIRTLLIISLFILPNSQLISQKKDLQLKKLSIAVMDFDSREGITRGEAASLSDVFSSQLVGTNEFLVVDRNRIKNILVEQGFQQTEACSEVECVVEAGKILKVEKMFVGVIGKIGRIYSVSIQVIDISTAQIQLNTSYQHDGNIEALVQEIIPDLAIQMAEQLSGKKDLQSTVGKRSSSKWLWYVGGAAVIGGGAAYYFLKPGGKTSTSTPEPDLPQPPSLP